MGLSDMMDKAKGFFSGNKDQVKEGIDKVGAVVDDKTGGEHTDKIEQGEEAAKDFVEGLE